MLISIELDNKRIIIASTDDGIYAMDGKCSHMGYDLSRSKLEDHIITCRLHGAQFDIRTGEVKRNMAAKRMRTYNVKIENDEVFIEL